MNYVYLGKIVNTHGIKGEIRILSDFNHKEHVFKKDFNVYIGKEKTKETLQTYRVHKNYDMVTLCGIANINDVLKYKGQNIYINREDLGDLVLNEDYIGLDVYIEDYVGKVTEIISSKAHDLLVIENEDKKYLVPKIDEFIELVNFDDKKIIIKNIKGLIDEN